MEDRQYLQILSISQFLSLFILASPPRPSPGISVQNQSIYGMFLKKNLLGTIAIIPEDISGLSFCLWNHIFKGVYVPCYTHQMIKFKQLFLELLMSNT